MDRKSREHVGRYVEHFTTSTTASVTRFGDLLDFGEVFKVFGNNYFAKNLLHSYAIFVKVSKSLIFVVKSFLGNSYRHLAIFFWSH